MGGKSETWRDVYRTVKQMSYAHREIISEVIKLIKLIKLIVLIPATNTSSEEQNQGRRNHRMILHIYKELTDSLFLHGSANDFVPNAN